MADEDTNKQPVPNPKEDHGDHTHIDEISGVETTGHSWDGLQELNNPLPRWWVWVWLISIIWSLWYFVIYPAWPVPGGHTEGTSGYTQFKELAESQAEIDARQAAYLEKFETASFEKILEDPQLYAFANAGGSAAFKDNCATCHGAGGIGFKGYPNLNDDDWLWGGAISQIHETIKYGIRSNHEDTRLSQMPAFGKDGLLKKNEVEEVVEHVMFISGQSEEANAQGEEIFAKQCASCHGDKGKGLREFGAPNLTDTIWLYGGDKHTIYETVYYARAGVMPAWEKRLDKNTIKQLAVYLHQLGGGEEEPIVVEEPAENGGETSEE